MGRNSPYRATIIASLLLGWGLAEIATVSAPVLAEPTAPVPGLLNDVTLSDYGNLARSSEILRRVLTPLTAAAIGRDIAHSAKSLSETPLDLASEKFLVYVPAQKPPSGYGLLVFVPPWQTAQLPQGWNDVLDKFGMIFVSAARSGNDEDILSRRIPLAVIATQNMMARYPVDPARVLVGGMSGGSRMALRLALGYPDLFQGALLNSGSDVIGTLYEPLPPAPLFHQFQTATRLLYVTGDNDSANLEQETRSKRAMQDWCVSDVSVLRMPFTGHEVAPPAILTRALTLLLAPERPDPERLAACRAGIETEVANKLGQVDALMANDKRVEARDALKDIDAKFGGLAAPRSIALDNALAAAP